MSVQKVITYNPVNLTGEKLDSLIYGAIDAFMLK